MTATITRQEAIALIDALPSETLPELVEFVRFLRFKTSPRTPFATDAEEQKLLKIIQHRLAPEQQVRLDRLLQKNELGELTPAEHAELVQITDQIEHADAERAQALIELARLRGKPITTIIHESAPEYAVNAD